MQIKIFKENEYNEDEVNQWLKDNPTVIVKDISYTPMYDFYTCYSPPQICNQWIVTTVMYEEET